MKKVAADFREKFISVFEDVASQLEGKDLESAKQLLIDRIDTSRVNEDSKRKMKSIIDSKTKYFDLLKYVWDAILAYKGEKVISKDQQDLNELKLSYDLKLKIAEKLDQVADMLEQAKNLSSPNSEQCNLMPEFTGDMPVFIIIQEMPTFTTLEPTEMPNFDIRDVPTF